MEISILQKMERLCSFISLEKLWIRITKKSRRVEISNENVLFPTEKIY